MHTVGAEEVKSEYAVVGSLDEFLKNIELKIVSKNGLELCFDLLHVHPSIANAIRRILIAEVPSMAIHDVKIHTNNTIFPNEYLAHRLGLVPITVDSQWFEYQNGSEATPRNSLKFSLNVTNETKEVKTVFSKDILWQPLPGQEGLLVKVPENVVICKLAPGNRLEMELSARKGTGAEHTKWSPVSLCSYRLMPRIELLREYAGEEAVKLQKCFSPGVIEIGEDGRAAVVNPRADTMSREVFRHPNLCDGVKILRESDWFCFTIEGITEDPLLLLSHAIQILKEKCQDLREEIAKITSKAH